MKNKALICVCVLMPLLALACKRSVSGSPVPGAPIVLISTPSQTAPALPGAITATAAIVRSAAEVVTITPTPAPPPAYYAIAFIDAGQMLNVRAAPGVSNDVLETLPAQTRDLLPAGGRQEADGMLWIEIKRQDGGTGWVSISFLTEQVAADTFCADPRLGDLLDRFVTAVKNQDGAALASLVSPLHGLTLQHDWWNPAVSIESLEEVRGLFTDAIEHHWGTASGSGEPIAGAFKDKMLPELTNVVTAQHGRYCNTLESGKATGPTTSELQWPSAYQNLNYVALYRPAPAEQELDWRTWAVGVEYVGGQPYIVVLVNYQWEV